MDVLLQHGALAMLEDSAGETALLMACKRSSLAIAERLVQTEPRCLLSCDARGWSPLHWAAALGHLNVCKLLARYGALEHASNTNMNPPVFLACERGAKVALLNNSVDSTGLCLLLRPSAACPGAIVGPAASRQGDNWLLIPDRM